MRAYAIAATALFLGGSILTFTGVSAWAESTTARPPAGQPEQRDRSQGPASTRRSGRSSRSAAGVSAPVS